MIESKVWERREPKFSTQFTIVVEPKVWERRKPKFSTQFTIVVEPKVRYSFEWKVRAITSS